MNVKIRNKKLQHDINREASKISALTSAKAKTYYHITSEELLATDQSRCYSKIILLIFFLREPL